MFFFAKTFFFNLKKKKKKKKGLGKKKKKNTWTERTSRTRRCRKLRPRHLHASAQVGLRDPRQNRYRSCAQDCYPQQKKIETYFFRVRKKINNKQNPNREQIQIPASELGSNNQRTGQAARRCPHSLPHLGTSQLLRVALGRLGRLLPPLLLPCMSKNKCWQGFKEGKKNIKSAPTWQRRAALMPGLSIRKAHLLRIALRRVLAICPCLGRIERRYRARYVSDNVFYEILDAFIEIWESQSSTKMENIKYLKEMMYGK